MILTKLLSGVIHFATNFTFTIQLLLFTLLFLQLVHCLTDTRHLPVSCHQKLQRGDARNCCSLRSLRRCQCPSCKWQGWVSRPIQLGYEFHTWGPGRVYLQGKQAHSSSDPKTEATCDKTKGKAKEWGNQVDEGGIRGTDTPGHSSALFQLGELGGVLETD